MEARLGYQAVPSGPGLQYDAPRASSAWSPARPDVVGALTQHAAPPYADVLGDEELVLDCRWLGLGGAGRVTELLLQRFQQDPPPGSWKLWGSRARLEPLLFAGARIEADSRDPRSWFGQRTLTSIPSGDIVLYMHQIRPLRPGRSVTVIHDTIPLRYGGTLPVRRAKQAFFLAASRLSTLILTDSEFSKRCIVRDLAVSPDKISVMRFPIDTERAARVAALRDGLTQEDVLLYVGRFDSHKNLERLCTAFAASAFADQGGRLLLVGGAGREIVRFRTWLAEAGIEGVELRLPCSETELDRLLASSSALVLPSFEEGYGLPAFEAVATGLPVAASSTGAIPELLADTVRLFDPHDQADMTRAIDEVAGAPPARARNLPESNLDTQVLASLARALARGRDRAAQVA